MTAPSLQYVQALQFAMRGAYPQAVSLFQQAVAQAPSHFESRLQLAKSCLDQVQSLARKPLSHIEPDELSGEAAHYLQLAQAQLDRLVEMRPASPHVQHMLAMVHLMYDRPGEALVCLKKALAKDPRNPDLLYNQGYALMQAGRYAEAVKQFTQLTTLHPRHAMGWHMLGEARYAADDPEAALPAYRQARTLQPNFREALGAMARALNMLDRPREVMEVLREWLADHPQDQDMSFSLAKQALSVGDWETGWRYYACRHTAGKRTPIPEDQVFEWQPERPVRVRFDQGLGDELHFLRFLPALTAKGMRIHYGCHPKLYPLLQGNPNIDVLRSSTREDTEEYDCLVGDLPWVAGMRSHADIPRAVPLPVDAASAAALREELVRFGPPPYLGLTWQGGREKKPGQKEAWRMLHKEISPAALAELSRDWPGTVVVMQRAPKPADLALFEETLGRLWLDWSALNDNLPEVLAGLSLLDEYVGVSNTNMHLLAGIGKNARVLVPHPADWRWMAEGEESPWFPGFAVYRQTRQKDWGPALTRLRADLASWGLRSGQSTVAE